MNFPKMKNTLAVVLLSVMTCLTAFGQQKESPIYDVVGRQVTGSLKKGVYIQNGRKYIVK